MGYEWDLCQQFAIEKWPFGSLIYRTEKWWFSSSLCKHLPEGRGKRFFRRCENRDFTTCCISELNIACIFQLRHLSRTIHHSNQRWAMARRTWMCCSQREASYKVPKKIQENYIPIWPCIRTCDILTLRYFQIWYLKIGFDAIVFSMENSVPMFGSGCVSFIWLWNIHKSSGFWRFTKHTKVGVSSFWPTLILEIS